MATCVVHISPPCQLDIRIQTVKLPSALKIVFKPFSDIENGPDMLHSQPLVFVVRQRLRGSDRVFDL